MWRKTFKVEDTKRLSNLYYYTDSNVVVDLIEWIKKESNRIKASKILLVAERIDKKYKETHNAKSN